MFITESKMDSFNLVFTMPIRAALVSLAIIMNQSIFGDRMLAPRMNVETLIEYNFQQIGW